MADETNPIKHLYGRDRFTIKEVCDFIESSGPLDALILIATNGVKDKDFAKQRQRVDILTYAGNPEVAATAIFNQAINFGEVENMLGLCKMLSEIANNAGYNISIEVSHRAKNN